MDEPISYDSFTSLPLLTGMFFEYSLRLDPEMDLPIVIVDQCDIQIWGWEPVKYKYKFFAAHKVQRPEPRAFKETMFSHASHASHVLGV